MEDFFTTFKHYSTIFYGTSFILLFIYINFFYLKKIYKKKIKNGYWNYIKTWSPFYVTLIIFFILSYFKNIIIKPNNDNQYIWHFILFAILNNILLLISTYLYRGQASEASEISTKYLNKRIRWPYRLCDVSIFINIIVIICIFTSIFYSEPTKEELLYLVQISSLVNLVIFFTIDHILLNKTSELLENKEKFKKLQDDTQEQFDKHNSLIENLKKDSAFAKYNVDFACLIGICLLSFIQGSYLSSVSDNLYEYAFISGGILIQIIITQVIFVLHQSKRLTKE